jgi:hypothetical protein
LWIDCYFHHRKTCLTCAMMILDSNSHISFSCKSKYCYCEIVISNPNPKILLITVLFAPSLFYCKASNESSNPTLSLTLAPHIYFLSKLYSFMLTISLNHSGQMETQMEFSTDNCRSKFIIT